MLMPLGTPSRWWRLVSLNILPEAWVVEQVQFFEDLGCAIDVTSRGKPLASVDTPENPAASLIDAGRAWNSTCSFQSCCGAWVGIEFPKLQSVRCIRVTLPLGNLPPQQAPLMAVQLSDTDDQWRNVATLPPRGGPLMQWNPRGAFCQNRQAMSTTIRGRGTTYLLTNGDFAPGQWQISEVRLFSDEACSADVTARAIVLDAGLKHEERNATLAVDGLQSTAFVPPWEGSKAFRMAALGFQMPKGDGVRCMQVDSDWPRSSRLLECDFANGMTYSTDSCRCIGWFDGSEQNMAINDTTFPSRMIMVYLLLLALALVSAGFLSTAGQRLLKGLRDAREAVVQRLEKLAESTQSSSEDEEEQDTPFLDTEACPAGQPLREQGLLHGPQLGEVPPVHELFRQRAAEAPGATCLRFADKDLSYGQVQVLVQELARRLVVTLPPQSVVGLLLDRQPSLIVAILAALTAGMPWVPLDDRAPAERLRKMLADADATLILVGPGKSWEGIGLPLGVLEDDGTVRSMEVPNERSVTPPPPDTACLYYTSGSTGEPKAVIMDQRFFVVNAKWYVDAFGVTKRSVVAAKARIIWATSLWEILPPLISGATLLLLPVLKTEEVAKRLAAGGATHLTGVPSELELVVEPSLPLQHLICMGERLMLPVAKRLTERLPSDCTLWNAYAATESPVTLWPVSANAPQVLAGRPLAGAFVAVLADDGSVATAEAQGEIVMGGVIPRYGYWRRPELTTEKFTDSPLGRVYRTGDMGRVLVDSAGTRQLEVTGRRDRQVKIRGQRVELGEVEATAAAVVESVKGAAVSVLAVAAEDGQQHMFLFAAPAAQLDAMSIRSAMQVKLPPYMVPEPHRIKLLDAMPRLPTGKVDGAGLRSQATALLGGEEHEAVDSLGTARRYSQQQMAMKTSIECANLVFLIGMSLFHHKWWSWGTSPMISCIGCSPHWLLKFLQGNVVGETSLYGFVVGGALLSSFQPDVYIWSLSDTAVVIFYLFMYCPWHFVLKTLTGIFPDVFGGDIDYYRRWYFLLLIYGKLCLIFQRRFGVPPALMLAIMVVCILCFPEDGELELNFVTNGGEGRCSEPSDFAMFVMCWLVPQANFASEKFLRPHCRKFLIAQAIYYFTVNYGVAVAGAFGRCLSRPRHWAAQAASALALLVCTAAIGNHYAQAMYPAQGFEVVEWPDSGYPFLAHPSLLGNLQGIIMLAVELLVPLVQIALVFFASYLMPGDRVKAALAQLVSRSLLGGYCFNDGLNMTRWLAAIAVWVCPCQCPPAYALAQLLAVVMFLLLVTFTWGYMMQQFLLKLLVPAVLRAVPLLRELLDGLVRAGKSSTARFQEGGR